MNALYGLFGDPATAQKAFDALRQEGARLGLDPASVVVISSEPYDGYEFSHAHSRSYMFPIAALGGILGGLGGYWLAAYTQTAYPLVTGGMPIVTSWTNGIVVYEMTMLGAILTTLVTLLITAGLPKIKPGLYDPEIWNGRILVGVADPPADARRDLESKLRVSGALAVKDWTGSA